MNESIDNRTINLAVIGTGSRARAFAHELSRLERVKLAWLCDVDAERLTSFIRQRKIDPDVRRSTNLHEILADPLLDGVILTVPDKSHKDIAIQCMRAGKHLMLE